MSSASQVACVEIGGIPISLSTIDPHFFNLLLQRYTGFLSSSRPEFELDFDIIDPRTVSDDDVRVSRDGEDWLVVRGDFRARLDPRQKKGTVRQNSNPFSLDSVLRILHSLILAERGGFLLHAASAICDRRVFLFSGVSGAGKTTITRLAPPDVTLLTDEISYIRPNNPPLEPLNSSVPLCVPCGSSLSSVPDQTLARIAPNEAPTPYRAFGTPFAGELARPGENTSAPVSALFFLEKGSENRIEEIPAPEAIRHLMRNILFFADDATLTDKLLATACDFVTRVPIRRLTFYPDSRAWDEVRRFEVMHV